jgi:hypothetical protein
MGPRSADEEKRKKAIFDGMSPRIQQRILKKGYQDWDPFMPPNDPIDLRKGKLQKTAMELTRDFFSARGPAGVSQVFGQGVWEIARGLVEEDERYLGMAAFVLWYEEEKRRLSQKF